MAVIMAVIMVVIRRLDTISDDAANGTEVVQIQ
jgi:hypothetical protein